MKYTQEIHEPLNLVREHHAIEKIKNSLLLLFSAF
jgi:hypothetical protein